MEKLQKLSGGSPLRNTAGFGHISAISRTGDFSERLSPQELSEFESFRESFNCRPGTTLFVEQQAPDKVLFLLAGQVKLSMNSSAGKRVILAVANPGETLGLASAFSRMRYDFTAETVAPCTIASLEREEFLEFLRRHPSAYVNVARELCLECARACEKVRRLGLTVTASARLVRFLLEQCSSPQQTERGTRVFCALTHGEIGECIGVSRETVTRLLSDFKCRDLLESRGSTLFISDRRALEAYAGIN
jgi:CRP/FNR family transcriptional regulator, cyclic AMP receptor protein